MTVASIGMAVTVAAPLRTRSSFSGCPRSASSAMMGLRTSPRTYAGTWVRLAMRVAAPYTATSVSDRYAPTMSTSAWFSALRRKTVTMIGRPMARSGPP